MNPLNNPMPTIERILGWTMAQDVRESIMLAQLDDFEPPQCESIRHNTEPEHHSGAAGFLFINPCHHPDGYRCVAVVKWMLASRRLQCGYCGLICESSDATFLPIAGQK